MFINSVVANSISDLAATLGLPNNSKDELVTAIMATPYNISSSSLAKRTWDAFAMEPTDINKNTEGECVKLIDTAILPQIMNYVDSKLNATLFPNFSYPFELEFLLQAFPNITSISMEGVVYGWGLCREMAIKFMALSELFLLADNTKPEYLAKSREYLSRSKEVLTCLIQMIERISNMIPPELGGGSSNSGLKIVTVKLRKSSNYNEFESC